MYRGNVLLIKGLVYKALGLTSLLLTKGGGDGGIQGSINIIGAFGGTFTKGILIRV